MSGKKLLTGVLLLFVAASVVFLLVKESRRGSQAAARPSGPAVAVSGLAYVLGRMAAYLGLGAVPIALPFTRRRRPSGDGEARPVWIGRH